MFGVAVCRRRRRLHESCKRHPPCHTTGPISPRPGSRVPPAESERVSRPPFDPSSTPPAPACPRYSRADQTSRRTCCWVYVAASVKWVSRNLRDILGVSEERHHDIPITEIEHSAGLNHLGPGRPSPRALAVPVRQLGRIEGLGAQAQGREIRAPSAPRTLGP